VGELAGVLLHALADEEPLQVGLAMPDLEVARRELGQADARLGELLLLLVPAVDDRLVEAPLPPR
jgi:hypothetical protein